MNFNFLLNTDFRDTHDSWGQLAGNIALSPYRFFFGGKTVTHLDLESQRLNFNDLTPRVWNNSRHWICTAVAIILVAPPTLIGIIIKGFHYCCSSTVEKKYRLLAFSYQYLQWKEAVEKDPSKKLEDFISIRNEERDIFLRVLLGIVNKDASQRKSLIPLLKELFSKPFSKDLGYLNAKQYKVRFASLWEEIKTFLKKSRETETEEEDLAMIADSIAEDQVQGALKSCWLSTQVFDCPDHLYDFFSKMAGKLSQEQREELHSLRTHKHFNVDIYTLSFFPYLTKEDRLDSLEKRCQSEREYPYFYVDDPCLFAVSKNNDRYKIRITSDEVTEILERLRKSGKKLKNRSFLVAALHTDFQGSFPFFQALEPIQAWHVFKDPNLKIGVRVQCQEEMKKKVQTLFASEIEYLLKISNFKDYQLFHGWITDRQLQSLLKNIDHSGHRIDRVLGDKKLFIDLLATLPNDLVIIRRFLLSLSEIQLFTVPSYILQIPYYVSRQFFALLNVDKPMPRFNVRVRERELESVMTNFFFNISVSDPLKIDLRKRLSLIISSISPRTLPYLWKTIRKSFCTYYFLTNNSWIANSESKTPLFKHVFSYSSFKRWKECVINGKLKDVEEQEFYRKVIPELEQCKTFEEEWMRKQFQKFCIILEEFLSYKPFQAPLLELESTDEEKKILEEIFVLFKTKMPSLGEICIDVLGRKKSLTKSHINSTFR